MAPLRYPGPICQTRDWFDEIIDGTLPRVSSPLPSSVGLAAGQAAAKRVVATGDCAFLNPRSLGTVVAPTSAFDRLRTSSSAAKISNATSKTAQQWPDGSSSAATEQEIEIDGQKFILARPIDADAKGKNLPTDKQVAEALRAIPVKQRAQTTKIILSPTAAPGSTSTRTIAGQAGSGEIDLFPVSQLQTQNDFDNRLMHESGHNVQGKLWSSAADVSQWQMAANADDRRPSPYAAETTGDDFCEFNILYNTARGTSCENVARQIYPNRWKKMEDYQSP